MRSIHVIDITKEGAAAGLPFPAARASAERMLRQVRRELRVGGVEETATLITAGGAAEAIRLALVQYQLPLLAMGIGGAGAAKSGRTGDTASRLGSTARTLLETSPCPVFTVGTACPADGSTGALQRILLVTDGARASLRAAYKTWPRLEADQTIPVYLVRPQSDFVGSSSHSEPIRTSEIRTCEETAALEYAITAETILRRAEELATELIVVSRRAGGCLGSFAAEELCYALATTARCPVLWVRAQPRGKTVPS